MNRACLAFCVLTAVVSGPVLYSQEIPGIPEQNVVTVVATRDSTWEQHPLSLAPLIPAVFTVSRTGPAGHELPVFYDVSGTAENGVDYQRLPGKVVIPAGQSTAQIYVIALDDDIPERPETVVVELRPPVCIAIYPPPPECYAVGEGDVAVASIFDNDPVTEAPEAMITSPVQGATFTEPAGIPIVVEAVDPDGWVQLVEFFANGHRIGERAMQFVVEPPPGQPQVFELVWSEVPAGLYELAAIATDQLGERGKSESVVVWVRGSPEVPVVNVLAVDRYAREEPVASGSNIARFKVRRDGGDLSQPLEVSCEILGTATNGEDYESLPGLVTIPAGRHCVSIPVVPIDDDEPEGRETVVVALFQPLDVEPPPFRVGEHRRAAAVIADRDYAPPLCDALPGGWIHICRTAAPGDAFGLEVTHDMIEWELVETLTCGPDGLHYVDGEPANRPVKCYRFFPIPVDPMAVED
jgi:hypothetical protein